MIDKVRKMKKTKQKKDEKENGSDIYIHKYASILNIQFHGLGIIYDEFSL